MRLQCAASAPTPHRIIGLARQTGRYGYRRVTALLRMKGGSVNPKRVHRIWRREGLNVPNKQPRRARLWFNRRFLHPAAAC